MDYTVERDGRAVKAVESIRLVLNDSGVREVAQLPIPYSASLQTLEILLARVITPDGKEIDVPPSAIFEQEAYASQAAPVFGDRKVKTIVFPQVTPGARVHLKTRVTQRVPIYDSRNFMDLPGPGAIRMTATNANTLAPWVAILKTERHYPSGCPNGEVSETLELKLPRSVRLLREPVTQHQSLVLSGSRIDYRQTVQREAESLKLTRTMTAVATEFVCSATDPEAQKAFAQKVDRS